MKTVAPIASVWHVVLVGLSLWFHGVSGQTSDPRATTTSLSQPGIGALILQGLGVRIESVTTSPSTLAEPTLTNAATLPTNHASRSTTVNLSLPGGLAGVDSSYDPVYWSTTGIEKAQSCFSAITSWAYRSKAFWSASIADQTWGYTVTHSPSIYSEVLTTTIYPSNVSTYRLCDGSPRVNVRPETKLITSVQTFVTEVTTYFTPQFSESSAPCKPGPEVCFQWYRYSNMSSGSTSEELSVNNVFILGECGAPAHMLGNGDWPCLIAGGPVELYYFPELTSNASCPSNRTVTTGNGSTTPTITTLGRTLTSGSVYLSFSTLYAYYDGFQGYNLGPQLKDHVFTLQSDDISSHCGGWAGAYGPGTMLDYADLNYPYPASAYKCAGRCSEGLNADDKDPHCKTIWSDLNPILAVPTKLRDMYSEWKTCSFWDETVANWLFDPPRALQPASAAATPTLSATTPSVQSDSEPSSPTAGGASEGPSPASVTTSATPLPEKNPSSTPGDKASTAHSLRVDCPMLWAFGLLLLSRIQLA